MRKVLPEEHCKVVLEGLPMLLHMSDMSVFSFFPAGLCLQMNCYLSYVWFYIHVMTDNSLMQEKEVGIYSPEHLQKSSA